MNDIEVDNDIKQIHSKIKDALDLLKEQEALSSLRFKKSINDLQALEQMFGD